MAKLCANQGTDAGQLLIKGLLNRHRNGTQKRLEFLLGNGQRICLIYRVGDKIHPPWKDLTDRADLGGDVLDTV